MHHYLQTYFHLKRDGPDVESGGEYFPVVVSRNGDTCFCQMLTNSCAVVAFLIFFEKGDFSHWKSEIALALGSPFANLNCKLRENDKNLSTCMQGLLEKHASQTKRL